MNTVTNNFQINYRIPEDYGHTAEQRGSTSNINSLPPNAQVEVVIQRNPYDSERAFVSVGALQDGARVVGTVSDGGPYSQQTEETRRVYVARQVFVGY